MPIVLLLAAISAVVLLVLTIGVPYFSQVETEGSTNSESSVVVIEESLDDFALTSTKDSSDKDNPTIRTNGYWSKPIIGIMFDSTELKYSDEADRITFDAIQGTGSIPSENKFTGWHILFHAILEAEEKQPSHLIIVDQRDAVITVKLVNDIHPKDKIAKTTLYINKQTKEIISADILIYRADDLYEKGLLDEVMIHEIGHSLGLGHSTFSSGIMSTSLSPDNSTLYEIKNCEFAAVRSLYLDHQVSENLKCG